MVGFYELAKRILTLYLSNLRLFIPLLALSLAWYTAIYAIPVRPENILKLMPPVLGITFLVSAYTELLLVKGFAVLMDGSREKNPGAIFADAGKIFPRFAVMAVLWLVMMVVGLSLLFLPAAIFSVWTIFVSSTAVLERTSVFGAFRRSIRLTHGHFFAILLRVLGISGITFFAAWAAGKGLLNAANAISPASAFPYLSSIINGLRAAFIVLALPVLTGTVVTLYYEIKSAEE